MREWEWMGDTLPGHRSRRVMFVGLNPGNKRIKTSVDDNQSLKRLHKWVRAIGIKHFSFVNCTHAPGNPTVKELAKDVSFLKECIVNMDYDAVIALGNTASAILKKLDIEHLKMPHPSPRNRKFNEAGYEEEKVEEAYEYVWHR